MSKLGFLILVCLAFAACNASSESPGVSEEISHPLVSFNDADFGESFPYELATASVVLRNSSNRSLHVTEIKPRLSGDTILSFNPGVLLPGRESQIKVQVDTGNASGKVARYFDVFAKGHAGPVGSFAVRGFVDWIVSPESLLADFGNIDLENGVDRHVRIDLRPGVQLKLLNVVGDNPLFVAKIEEDGQSLSLKSKPDAPLGIFDNYIIVSTNNSDQKKIGIHVRGQVVTRTVPDSNPVDFGLARMGESPERLVRFENLDGKAISIDRVHTEGTPAKAEFIECMPVAQSCKLLRLKVDELKNRGQLGGIVHVRFKDSQRDFPLRFGLVVVGKETQVRDLAEDMQKAAAIPQPLSTTLKSAVQAPLPPVEMPKPPGTGPLITWSAAHEHSIYGYEIYRAIAQSGPYERLNSKIIPKLDDTGTLGSVYRWRDNAAVTGKEYWYYVDVVNLDGSKARFSTPQKVTAK